jgi:hypothetical protein
MAGLPPEAQPLTEGQGPIRLASAAPDAAKLYFVPIAIA